MPRNKKCNPEEKEYPGLFLVTNRLIAIIFIPLLINYVHFRKTKFHNTIHCNGERMQMQYS